MKIAVHWTDTLDSYSFSPRWVEYLREHGHEVVLTNMRRTDVISHVRGCDGVMWHWCHVPDDKQTAHKILNAIEQHLGLAVFPDFPTSWHYDEKISQHYLLDAVEVPKIKSWVFWDYEEAESFLRSASYPLVFKLSVGAASANVVKVHNYKEAIALVDKTFKKVFFPYSMNEFSFQKKLLSLAYYKSCVRRTLNSIPYIFANEYPPLPVYYLLQKNYAYFQEFCANNPCDIRITVIGNRAWGFLRENRSGDFRASGSGKIDYDPSHVPIEAVKLAFETSRKINTQSLAYDIMYDNEGNLVINEVTYCFVFRAVYNAPGYWDSDLNWHEGHLYPQDAQAEDLIQRIAERRKISQT